MRDIFRLPHAESISPELGTAIRAAKAAGDVIAAGSKQRNHIEQKGVGDLVSQVDRDADLAAANVLREESDFPILSEELGSDQVTCSDMWIVDPLDATSAFLMQAGDHYPSVLVALRKDSRTHLGVVYFPLTDEWFYAQQGRGAWNDGKRLVCDKKESLSDVWIEMNQYGDASFETSCFAELRNRLRSEDGALLVTSNVPHSGVAMRIAAGSNPLAAAIHDNNVRSMKQAPWDVAAPQIIMEEAGGVFVNSIGRRVDPFHVEQIIVARSPELAQQIVDLLIEQPVR